MNCVRNSGTDPVMCRKLNLQFIENGNLCFENNALNPGLHLFDVEVADASAKHISYYGLD